MVDSNAHRTKNSLDQNKIKWTIANNIYTTVELLTSLEDQEIIEQIRKQDHIVIQQGTNDIRHGRGVGEAKAYQNMMEAVDRIKQNTSATIHLVQIPPLAVPNRYDLNVKAAMYNTRLETTKTEGVQIIQTAQEYKKRTTDDIIDRHDGIHLTKEGQDILKQALEEAITAPRRSQTTSGHSSRHTRKDSHTRRERSLTPNTSTSDINTTIVETKPEYVKHIIGREGGKIKQLELDHDARIKITNSKSGSKITIKAPGEEASRAKTSIKNIIKARQSDNKTAKDKVICKYFLQGNCMFGEECRNEHTKGNKRPRSPSPGQTTYTHRPRQSSTHRQPQTTRQHDRRTSIHRLTETTRSPKNREMHHHDQKNNQPRFQSME